ncbi:MAG: nucleoside 2-deoxyribosyltransferase, partial [Halothiobacillaceae bacterium]
MTEKLESSDLADGNFWIPAPRIYLAGPDLFYPDAMDRYARLKALCESYGVIGVSPLDGSEHIVASGDFSPRTAALLY